MALPYAEKYPVGSSVRIATAGRLEDFRSVWKYHHKLTVEQLKYAGEVVQIEKVGFYHGGDVLYELRGVPGIWHEECLDPAPSNYPGSVRYSGGFGVNGLTDNRTDVRIMGSQLTVSERLPYTYGSGGNPVNGNGRLIATQAGSVYYNRGYDTLGRVTVKQRIYWFATGLGDVLCYNLASELTGFTFPSGRIQNITYDTARRVTGSTDSFDSLTTNFAKSFSYFPSGTLQNVTLGNGLLESTTLNSRLQITGRSAVIGSATPLNLTIGYDAASSNNANITSEQIVTSSGLNVTQTFTPDAYNRLLGASESGGWSQTYVYDAYGNRAVTAGYRPNLNLTPTATSQFTANRWLGSGSSAAVYDAAGNETSNSNTGKCVHLRRREPDQYGQCVGHGDPELHLR